MVGEERESEEQKKRRNEVEAFKSRFPRMPRQEQRERNQGIIMTIPYYLLERLTKRQDIKGGKFFLLIHICISTMAGRIYSLPISRRYTYIAIFSDSVCKNSPQTLLFFSLTARAGVRVKGSEKHGWRMAYTTTLARCQTGCRRRRYWSGVTTEPRVSWEYSLAFVLLYAFLVAISHFLGTRRGIYKQQESIKSWTPGGARIRYFVEEMKSLGKEG